MKKTLILPECEWILTEEARNDSKLNPTDKNVLAVLQYMLDNKEPLEDGFYAIVLRTNNNVDYTLEGTLKDFGFKIDESTIGRSINKLWRLGYLEYRRGFYNAKTNSGQPPKIRILNGTVSATDSMTEHYSIIADTKDISGVDNEKLSTGVSESCSIIADTKNKEQEKEISNSTIAVSTTEESTVAVSSAEVEKKELDVAKPFDVCLPGFFVVNWKGKVEIECAKNQTHIPEILRAAKRQLQESPHLQQRQKENPDFLQTYKKYVTETVAKAYGFPEEVIATSLDVLLKQLTNTRTNG